LILRFLWKYFLRVVKGRFDWGFVISTGVLAWFSVVVTWLLSAKAWFLAGRNFAR
jgi:hypothetical protein